MKITDDNIKNIFKEANIREMILGTVPPLEWASDDSHPISSIGYYYFGICDGFKFDIQKVNDADELLLWKLYGLMEGYWQGKYKSWMIKERNMIYKMRNCINVEAEDLGKDLLTVYEKHFDWR